MKDFSNDLSVSIVIDSHNFSLNLQPSTEAVSNPYIEYRPNTQSLSGFQVSWEGLTVAYLTKAPLEQESEILKGSTSYEDIRGALFFGNKDQWGLIGYYNRFKGLYIENSLDIDNSLSLSDPKIQRDDIEVFSSGLAVIHIFSPERFSMAASYLQTARQTKNGGSWLGMLTLDGSVFSADSAIIPSQVQSDYGEDAEIEDGKFSTATISLGYGYTFVVNHFYASLTLLLGRGYQYRSYQISGVEKESSAATTKTNFGLSAGYNADHFFTGFTYVVDSNQYVTESLKIQNSVNTLRFFLGTRF